MRFRYGKYLWITTYEKGPLWSKEKYIVPCEYKKQKTVNVKHKSKKIRHLFMRRY
jgi:hypothetical protein